MKLTFVQKQTIRELRASGCTYSEIRKQVSMPLAQSSLSYICRDIQLPAEHNEKIRKQNIEHLRRIAPKAVERNKEIRAQYLDCLREKNLGLVRDMSPEACKIALAMLYLGEGSKWPGYRGLSLGSSEAHIIRIYIGLLQKCYGITTEKLRARVQYRADQDIVALETYWSAVTGIPKEQFYKTCPDARTIGKTTKKRDYRGVCAIMCSGTEMQLELAAIADLLSAHLGH